MNSIGKQGTACFKVMSVGSGCLYVTTALRGKNFKVCWLYCTHLDSGNDTIMMLATSHVKTSQSIEPGCFYTNKKYYFNKQTSLLNVPLFGIALK